MGFPSFVHSRPPNCKRSSTEGGHGFTSFFMFSSSLCSSASSSSLRKSPSSTATSSSSSSCPDWQEGKTKMSRRISGKSEDMIRLDGVEDTHREYAGGKERMYAPSAVHNPVRQHGLCDQGFTHTQYTTFSSLHFGCQRRCASSASSSQYSWNNA